MSGQLRIYEGPDSETNVIASLSGNFSQDISSTGSKLLLRFITTKKNEVFREFSIRYEGKYTIKCSTCHIAFISK